LAPPCKGRKERGGGGGGEKGVALRTADGAHGVGAAVLLVVGVQDKRMSRARAITGLARYFGSTIFHSIFMKFRDS